MIPRRQTPELTHELGHYNSTESRYLPVSVSLASSVIDSSDRIKRTSWNDQYQPFQNNVDLILDIGEPALCVFGLFGNFMINLIMFRLPASTSSVFFQILALSDQLMIIINPLNGLLYIKFNMPSIDTLGSWHCKVYTMMVYTTAALSPWMLVALTVLRTASVLWPLRVNAVWTKRMSRVTAGIMTVVIILFHCHFLYGYGIGSCAWICCVTHASEMYRRFMRIVWPWIDMINCCFLPFMLLGISNSVLVWTVVRSVRTGARLPIQQTTQDSRQRKVTSLTVTLIVTNMAFFLLTTPSAVYLITSPYVNHRDPIQAGRYAVFQAAGSVLTNSNNAVNFYLYCLTGAKFRAEFRKILFGIFCLFSGSSPLRRCNQHK